MRDLNTECTINTVSRHIPDDNEMVEKPKTIHLESTE